MGEGKGKNSYREGRRQTIRDLNTENKLRVDGVAGERGKMDDGP